MRLSLLVTAGLLLVTGAVRPAAGQSSQFGSRGLGLPARPYSAHSLGLGGGLALFDAESGVNPAALGALRMLQAGGVSASSWRSSHSPTGNAPGRDTRYPLFQAAGPIATSELGVVRLVAGVSLSAYSDRNFSLASRDSLLVRDELLEVRDTLVSLGGLSDLRLGLAWNLSPALTVGGGLHLISGSARIRSVRVLMSDDYHSVTEVAELSYLSYGASFGIQAQVTSRLALAGIARLDTPARMERDTTRIRNLDLPLTLGAGAEFAAHTRLRFAGHLLYRGWGRADATIKELGGIGARNSTEMAGGLEWATTSRSVTRWPLRLGVHHTTLPFPLQSAGQGRETGIAIGTGSHIGLGGRASFNAALERIWRSEGAQFRERAFQLTAGITIRPAN